MSYIILALLYPNTRETIMSYVIVAVLCLLVGVAGGAYLTYTFRAKGEAVLNDLKK